MKGFDLLNDFQKLFVLDKQKICIVTSEFPPQPGGIGNHAYHLALYLSKNGYDVVVIADQRALDNNIEKTFDALLPFTINRIRMRKFRFLMYLQRIRKTFQNMKDMDSVIATGKFSLWNVAFCAQFFKCRFIAIIHGSEVNFKSLGIRKTTDVALKQFDTVIAVSNYTKQLVSHLNLNIEVIPNGIDIDHWNETNGKKPNFVGDPILTTVGRVSSRKGQLQVIKLLPDLIRSYPKIHYHCVGIPSEVEAFCRVARELNVDGHITFHGVLENSELKAILCATDVFVMLSKESSSGDIEGFGIAILEANALGIPAIGSKNCGIEDAIDHGKNGFLIDGNDSNEFCASIQQILEHRDYFKKKSRAWSQAHDWGQIVKRYIALLS